MGQAEGEEMKWARDPRVLHLHHRSACLHDLVRAAANLLLKPARRKMAKPIRPAQFSTRKIALFVLVMTLATALTIWGTFYVWETFVLSNHNDPLTKSGGLSPMQERAQRSK
jgi:hypothetical protein